MGKKLNKVPIPDSPRKQFARIIRHKRRELGITLQEIQNKCGVHRGYMWYVENGQRMPTIETLMRIEKGLGIKCGTLVKKAVELLKDEVYK